MKKDFTVSPLKRVIEPVERPEQPIPGKEYRQVGVQLWGRGAYEREPLDGGRTRYKTLSRVEKDDIIVNKIWARNGSVAVVPPSLAGCFASNEFPTFRPNSDQLVPRWFHWLTKTNSFWQQCDEKSRGTSGKNRIRPEKFLEILIPLPSLPEQRRIVARIEELSAKVDEARSLRLQIESESESLCRAILFESSNQSAVPTRMRELVMLKEAAVVVDRTNFYQFAGVYCFGGGVFKGRLKAGSEFSYVRLTRLSENDFVYPKLMAWEGALGVVPASCDGLFVSPEFPVFEIDQARVLPETLDVYFRTPSVWPTLGALSTGTNVRRRRLHPARFLEFEIPLPPMAVQQRLRATKRKLFDLKPAQTEVAAKLGALMPSILSRAFSGDL